MLKATAADEPAEPNQHDGEKDESADEHDDFILMILSSVIWESAILIIVPEFCPQFAGPGFTGACGGKKGVVKEAHGSAKWTQTSFI